VLRLEGLLDWLVLSDCRRAAWCGHRIRWCVLMRVRANHHDCWYGNNGCRTGGFGLIMYLFCRAMLNNIVKWTCCASLDVEVGGNPAFRNVSYIFYHTSLFHITILPSEIFKHGRCSSPKENYVRSLLKCQDDISTPF